jgi:ElaB/YqjD/DUF883 family membrane-anchored ribosome-binding protein
MVRSGEGGLDAASQRLTRALDKLEGRLRDQKATAEGEPEVLNRRLVSELNELREREKQLEEAAAEASAALGRAAEQIRMAMEEEDA